MNTQTKSSRAEKTRPIQRTSGEPVADSHAEQPTLLKRADVVAVALVGLLLIAIVGFLYFAKPFLLPIGMAFVIGTMLSPAATFAERHHIPRAVSAVLIVATASAGVALMIGLIAAPLMQWVAQLPQLIGTLKDKLHGPLTMWQRMRTMLDGGGSSEPAAFPLPKVEWVQSAFEFLSPTFAEFLLFVATLILFIASWRSLRQGIVMTFADHDKRLRSLKILNQIESSLGSYLLTVTTINLSVGIGTGVICAVTGMPNPAGLGALAAVLNFLPYIGPVAMFAVLTAVGLVSFPTIGGGLMAPAAFVAMTLVEGHFITPAIIGRRLELNALAVFTALAFWTWLWGPLGGFLACPLLIVALVLKEYLLPQSGPQLPGDD